MENLVGRYLKVLEHKQLFTTLKNGEYLKVTEDNRGAGNTCIRIEKYGVCDFKHWIEAGVLELMPEGWSPEGNAGGFTVGKWYKCYFNDDPDHKKIQGYLKFSGSTSTLFNFSEIIDFYHRTDYQKEASGWSNKHVFIEVPLSVIQKYLPEGHPDKVKTPVSNSEEWVPKVGDWVVILSQGCAAGGSPDINPKVGRLEKGEYTHYNYCFRINGIKIMFDKKNIPRFLRPARPDEIPSHKLSKEELLEEARRRYPKGTQYKSTTDPHVSYIRGELKLTDRGDDYIQITDGYGGSVYYNGKWAEIIESPAAKIIRETNPDDLLGFPKMGKPRIILMDSSELLSVNTEKEVKVKLLDL